MVEFAYTISGADLWTWRSQAIAQAQEAHIDPAEVDWLLQGLCQVGTLALRLGSLAQQPAIPAAIELPDLEALWQKRVSDRAPIQQLVGTTVWRNFTLRVSPAVLIPRPETELIIDIVVALINQSPQAARLQQGTWVDLGTGSGAIALGLAAALPQAHILAVDVSDAALAIARQNAVANGLGDRIQFLQGSWFEPLTAWAGQLAGIVSNPPYIPSAIVPTLDPEVAQHEPHLALDGGPDGLAAVRHLVATAPRYLQPGGLWGVELMAGQAPAVIHLLRESQAYTDGQATNDYAGIERFVTAYRQ
ncbi:MAG: peptide chain release factor N(5)-glutamine methyltransferase [Leptolyngbyaceae cyanobacterium]